MKKLLVIPLLLMLTACGGVEKQESAEPKAEPTQSSQKKVSNEETEPEKTENDIVFTEAGQKSDVGTGMLELLKIKNVNEIVDIAPLKITVKDIKLFKMTDMTDEHKESLKMYNDNNAIGDALIYVQVSYEAENTEEKNVGWASLMNAVTDKGQQIDIEMNDMIYTDADGSSEYLGKVKKDYADGFIVKDEDISKIKFIWGSSYDTDTYQDITEEQQVEYTF